MLDLFIFLRGTAIGLLLSLVVLALYYSRQHYAGKTLIFFACCVICYLLAPLLYKTSGLFYLTDPFSNATPLAFLLLTQALFDDHSKPSPGSAAVGLFYMYLTYTGVILRDELLIESGVGVLIWQTGRILMFAVLLYSIYLVIRHWREDLVEPRRILRVIVTCMVGLSILVVVFAESVITDQAFPLWISITHTLLIIGFIISFGIALLALGEDQFVLAGDVSKSKPLSSSTADQREVELITKSMQSDRLYRDTELSIRSFAKQLEIPEHRLRKHINSRLGYRNFNDFLNQYRITEVTSKLKLPELARTPVLTIAMDSGYRSLTTFNKAFKALEGVTPKEYRQQQLLKD